MWLLLAIRPRLYNSKRFNQTGQAKMIARYAALVNVAERPKCQVLSWQEVACPACGSLRGQLVLQAVGWHHYADKIFAIAECQVCRVWYTNPLPVESLDDKRHGVGSSDSAGEAAKILAAQVPKPPAQGAWLLHFGPADVRLARWWLRRGWQVTLWRQEPCQVPQEWWLAGGFAVFGALADLALSCHKQITAITAYDWFEYQADLPTILKLWRMLLAPQGRLVLLLPNLAGVGFHKYSGMWRGLELPFRRVHFSPETLARLLVSRGWRICRWRTYPCPSWLRLSAQRWRQWQIRGQLSWWQRCRLAWGTCALGNAMTAWASRLLGRGDQLVLVARP